MENKTARTIMRRPEVALRRLMTIDKVSDHLTKHQLPGAPVVNKIGELIGYVSEFDCLQQLMQSSYYRHSTSLVEDVMSTKLIMSRPDISLIDLASTMNASRVNVMPIVEDGKLVGAVARSDIMREMVKDL
ncbi:MAG: CBS-domain-containing membrane protein [Cellvibrionaceae bacterium]|jgi:CBS-domain-containing membrane protein